MSNLPSDISYEEVEHLAEKLSAVDQRRLIVRLQALSKQRELTLEEWQTLFETTVSGIDFSGDFSPDRESWYGDDGR